MAAENFQTPEYEGSFFKRSQIPLLFVFCLTAVILLGVHAAMKCAVHNTIRAKAEGGAMHWAAHFNDEMTDLSTIAERGELSEHQKAVVDAALRFSEVYSFTVFDPEGALVYSNDYGVVHMPAQRQMDDIAKSVLSSGTPRSEVFYKPNGSENQDVFVQVFVPLLGADGDTMGVLGVFLNKTESAAVYVKVMTLFALAIPAMCAVSYAVPALAYVMKREQAHARTRRVALLSRFDQLTGALNRHTMTQECTQLFAERPKNDVLGIFFLDIDTFKTVNDEYGHEFGDAYLHFISTIILASVRPGDLVGRMGGDEFVIAVRNADSNVMRDIGENILREARKPFGYQGTTMQASVSIGYHLADQFVSQKEALHAADLALYHAKSSGRNAMVEYFPELDTALSRRREVEAQVRSAMLNDEFEAVFQPITDPSEQTIVGFEALLRLTGKDGDPISPTEFIPIAEETGMIQEIGTFVLREAITQAKTWPDHVFVSVNLSPAQFKQGDLVNQVAGILKELDFPASRLEFEVTEGLLMADEQRVSDQLVGLKHLGISIAMDDFGTGYSSLGYLWKYDFDKLKIDRVFLEGFDFNRERYSEIIETIVILGHKMGMKVTVEGVETEKHQEMLDQLACDQYQGFFFGKPMPAAEAFEAVNRPMEKPRLKPEHRPSRM